MKLQKQDIPFTMVANEVLYRNDLSLKAKGMFAYLFSKPDGWDFSGDRIALEMKGGRKIVYSALKELEECGLLTRDRQPDGKMDYVIKYSDRPIENNAQKPLALFGQEPKRQRAKRGSISNTVLDSNKDIYIGGSFFEEAKNKTQGYREIVKNLTTKDFFSPKTIHQIVMDEFIPYWTEKSAGGKLERWQKEKVFDPVRRLTTWIKNKHDRDRDYKCQQGVWHRKGYKCECVIQKKEEALIPIPKGMFDTKSLADKMKV